MGEARRRHDADRHHRLRRAGALEREQGDLVYCDLPEVGRLLEVGDTFGEIESVKAVSDLNSPIAGEVVEVNTQIEDHLEILAKDPWKAGWLIRIKPNSKNLDDLMDAAAYEKFLAETAAQVQRSMSGTME